MNKKLITSLLIIVVVVVTGFYSLHNTIPKTELSYSDNNSNTSKNNTDEQTYTGYLVKYKDLYVFSDCNSTKIYEFPQPANSNVKYENVDSSVALSILNNENELTLNKIEVLNKKCDPKDDIQLIQNTLIGYGAMSKNETFIQDGHELVLDQTKSVGTKNIFTFQFLHYGDPFNIYHDTITVEKGLILDDKYETKTMNPDDMFEAKGKIAVFFSPNDAEIEEMKKDDEQSFYIVADDNMYNQSTAGKFLEKNNIKTVYTNKRYIHFIKDNPSEGEEMVLDREALNQYKFSWGVLLFDGKNSPLLADMSNVQPDYEKYFK